jgi:serine O-acetyltransferase
LIFLLYNSDVPSSVVIGQKSVFGHSGIGVVLHPKSVIGAHCIIGQGITVGGRSRMERVPTIGSHVYIGAGARVLGAIDIGDHVFIAPNAVVIEDVPPHTMVGGVPAKVLKTDINVYDYI